MTIETDPTPNPNSVKLTPSSGPVTEASMLAIKTAADAEGDALGEALIGIDGVVDVFMTPAFVTITKTNDTSWGTILPRARALITEHLSA